MVGATTLAMHWLALDGSRKESRGGIFSLPLLVSPTSPTPALKHNTRHNFSQQKLSNSINWQAGLVVGGLITSTSHFIFRTTKTSLSKTLNPLTAHSVEIFLNNNSWDNKALRCCKGTTRSTINVTAFQPVIFYFRESLIKQMSWLI